ncbi:hypothetical protein AB3N59_02475 [Leptospira sp. WS92.C1]
MIHSETISGLRVVEVFCMDVCEKNRIAIANRQNSKIGNKITLVTSGSFPHNKY